MGQVSTNLSSRIGYCFTTWKVRLDSGWQYRISRRSLRSGKPQLLSKGVVYLYSISHWNVHLNIREHMPKQSIQKRAWDGWNHLPVFPHKDCQAISEFPWAENLAQYWDFCHILCLGISFFELDSVLSPKQDVMWGQCWCWAYPPHVLGMCYATVR